jgi:hypothetical protein
VSAILVEARRDPNCRPILDELAKACAALGHKVRRWCGPLSGRVPYSRRLVRCDLAILFNGAHRTYSEPLRQLRGWGSKLLFVELGWYPQLGRFQLDPQGINAAASWVNEPLVAAEHRKLPGRPVGDLLVLLQDDADTQITDHSPWFADMYEFVSHLKDHSKLPLRVRAHPRHLPTERLTRMVACRGSRMDACPQLADALDGCRAVACVNSSAAVEAMAKGIPVLCYGRAIYRHRGAVYCMEDNGSHTQCVTAELAEGACQLSVESISKMLGRIDAQQWRVEQIPARLPPIINAQLPSASVATAKRGWCWPFFRRAG